MLKNKLIPLGSLATVLAATFVTIACGEQAKSKKEVAKVDLAAEKAKIWAEFDTVDVAHKTGQDFTNAKEKTEVIAKFNKLCEIAAETPLYGAYRPFTAALAPGVKIKSALVKTAYDPATQKLVLTLTITDGKQELKKDVTIRFGTFDASAELAKIASLVAITKSADTAAKGTNFGALEASADNKKNAFLAIAELATNGAWLVGTNKLFTSALANGCAIETMRVKENYSFITGQMVVTITLTKTGGVINRATTTKDVTFTFGGEDLTSEVAKLKAKLTNVPSEKATPFTTLVAQSTSSNREAKAAYESLGTLIYTSDSSSLSPGVTIQHVTIKKGYDRKTRSITLTVALAKQAALNGLKYGKNVKDVSITFAAP